MKKSYQIIFFGILVIAMGYGDDPTEFIPFQLKMLVGIIAIAYGVYIIFASKRNHTQRDVTTENSVGRKRSRPSYTYLTVGVLFWLITKYLIHKSEYSVDFWIILFATLGTIISVYGLVLLYKEKLK